MAQGAVFVVAFSTLIELISLRTETDTETWQPSETMPYRTTIKTKRGRRHEFLTSISTGREFGSHFAAARGWVAGWRKSDWNDLSEVERESIDSKIETYLQLVDEYHSFPKNRLKIEPRCVGIIRGIYNVVVQKHRIKE
jgi:hypothetical protein